MGKKRRRKADNSKDGSGSLSHNPFAALKGREASRADPSPSQPTPTDAKPAPQGVPNREAVKLTEEELFAQAVADIDPVSIVKGKYDGRGPDTSHIRIREEQRLAPAEVEDLGPPSDPYHDDLALFEEAMGLGHVAPIENHLAEQGPGAKVSGARRTGPNLTAAQRAELREAALEAIASTLGPTLRPAQKNLVKQAHRAEKRGDLPSVNVRGDTRDIALRRIELSVLEAASLGRPYVRVVTGKGRNSDDEPVLKEALVEWCYGEGEAFVIEHAPEVLPDSTFGSYVLHVRRTRRR